MTSPEPIPKTGVLAAGLIRKIPRLTHLVELVEYLRWQFLRDNGEGQEPANGNEHPIDPADATDGFRTGAWNDTRADRRLILEPCDEES